MFNPAVTDKTADYMFEGMQNQVRMDEARRVRNDQMLQQSVGQAMDALSTAGAHFQQVATKNAAVDGRVHAFEKLSSTNPEIFDPAFAAELVKEPNRNKRAGMLATWEEAMPLKIRQGGPDKTGQTFVATDPITGEKMSYLYTNKGQVAPMNKGAGLSDDPEPQYDASGNLIGHVLKVGNRATFVKAPAPATGLAAELMGAGDSAERRRNLETEIAGMQKQVDAGNKKFGPDFLPDWMVGKYADDIAKKRAELEGLPAASAAPGAAVTAPAGGGGGSNALEQARAAIAKGANRDKVIERLKQLGVDTTGI